ncbi:MULTISPECIES: ABC transporter permease [unclassified Microbacterium]|uniref:ABC transporter permease n=1 Tax=unclassified Microbacterium TaxID=2609290 RepID=UPI00097ECE8E|nr:ABC transporter permease [Microbacterium sp. JB110]RCS61472.1 ABC transporter permease [Microbacterium sp. JB110]SJM65729.1 Dipeptide transport system permease protein DppB (TC 3.A.1.5.2) [Frigoribacterium sp. JB110]
MLSFIARRLVGGIVLLVVASSLTYLLMNANSSGIAIRILGDQATAEQIAAKTTELGLDRPLAVRFGEWLFSAVRGDFGASWFTSEGVWHTVTSRLPVTMSLVVGTVIVTAIVSTLLGVLAATRRGVVDRVVQVISVFGAAAPNFWVGLMLVIVFALSLHWFPATGFVSPSDSFTGWTASITLPIIALALGAIAAVTQQVRSAFIEVEGRDYVRTLRSRGLGERTVLFVHVLRGAATPALTVLALQFVALLGGAVVVERVFALPGLGETIASATTNGDIPLVMGVVVVSVAMVVVVNLLIDIVTGWINPKARLS